MAMKNRTATHARQAVVLSLSLAAVLFLPPFHGNSTARQAALERKAVPPLTVSRGAAEAEEHPASEPVESPEEAPAAVEPVVEAPPAAEIVKPAIAPRDRDEAVRLRVLDDGNVRSMTMAEYLAGVLRGEMPASFEEEALKAQAVAARTYTRRMAAQGSKHGSVADVCTDYRCCQAYKSEAQARKDWGAHADEYEAKIEAAVSGTDGELLLYDGAPILAVFHSSSPGLTQNVEDVWGGALPYLVPVTSPEEAESVPNYYSRASFKLDTFRKRVLSSYPDADLSGAPETWLTNAVRNDAGTVETLSVGGVSMRGAKLRSILNLRSACFVWEVEQENDETRLVFYVTGYGHGVGLSQYGANQMARGGENYQTILTHYYTGVTLGGYSG